MSKDRIKSAWEIALEKTEKLGKLSPEEIKQAQEKEFYPRGKALAGKYLKGMPDRDISAELARYSIAAEKKMVLKGFYDALAAELSFDETDKSRLALDGFTIVSPDKALEKIKSELLSLIEECLRDKDRLFSSSRDSISGIAEEKLRQEGISGSAVQVNIPATGEWLEALKQLRLKYEGRLSSLKARLLATCKT